jgi:undecaprenyl diphosphate synthase
MSEQTKVLNNALPQHVGIIMDGNGRWAERQGKPRVWGHKKGVDAVRRAVSLCRKLGIPSLTLFAFSSENWRRPEDEVSSLMELFLFVLQKEVKALHKNQVRLNIIGDLSKFSAKLQQNIAKAQELTSANTGLTLNVAANYGGRWDIINASQQLAAQVAAGTLAPEAITEELFAKHIQMHEQPELDLLIRTGGDIRISNFLLWQAAYAELCFIETLWPDFDDQVFADAIASFVSRERRFGCTGTQIRELAAGTVQG